MTHRTGIMLLIGWLGMILSTGWATSRVGCTAFCHRNANTATTTKRQSNPSPPRFMLKASAQSEADRERLLMGKVGMTAFVVAEMQHFCNESMVEWDNGIRYGPKWKIPDNERIQVGILLVEQENDKTSYNAEYLNATKVFQAHGDLAVEGIVNATAIAFSEGYQLLSALGSAIIFFRDYYRTPTLIAACERVGLSDYAVAHHITDMYHHRSFRGAYTKTLAPSGAGEVAARIAVGLESETTTKIKHDGTTAAPQGIEDDENDECLLWSPTTPGVCLHWKSEDEAWRKKRFERIQMEGTRDPRRGGSGTTR